MKITLCRTCALGRSGFAEALGRALAAEGLIAELASVDCMSGCARPSTLSVRAPGKTAYLFGDLVEDDLTAVVEFLRLYAASPTGDFADARPLGAMRFKALARIPG